MFGFLLIGRDGRAGEPATNRPSAGHISGIQAFSHKGHRDASEDRGPWGSGGTLADLRWHAAFPSRLKRRLTQRHVSAVCQTQPCFGLRTGFYKYGKSFDICRGSIFKLGALQPPGKSGFGDLFPNTK